MAFFNTLCCHNLQDRQTILALRFCCFHVLSVGQHSVQVDPKVYKISTASSNVTPGSVKSAPQCLCLVWADARSGVLAPLGYAIQLLLYFGCLVRYFVSNMVMSPSSATSASVLCQYLCALGWYLLYCVRGVSVNQVAGGVW